MAFVIYLLPFFYVCSILFLFNRPYFQYGYKWQLKFIDCNALLNTHSTDYQSHNWASANKKERNRRKRIWAKNIFSHFPLTVLHFACQKCFGLSDDGNRRCTRGNWMYTCLIFYFSISKISYHRIVVLYKTIKCVDCVERTKWMESAGKRGGKQM